MDDLDINLHDYGFRYYDPAIGRWTSIDPMAEVISEHSTFAYVRNNPVLLYDPDGMLDNEYVKDIETGELLQVGTEGGDEVDYVYEGTIHKDDDGNVTGAAYSTNIERTKIHYVQKDYSSGIDTRHTQGSDPTPGHRNIHGSMPTDIKAYGALASEFYAAYTGVSAALGFAANKLPRVPKGKAFWDIIKNKAVKGGQWMRESMEGYWPLLKRATKPKGKAGTHTTTRSNDVDRAMEELLKNWGRKASDSMGPDGIGPG